MFCFFGSFAKRLGNILAPAASLEYQLDSVIDDFALKK